MSERDVALVYSDLAAMRLDKYLAANLPEFSRTRLQTLIKAGCVSVNDIPAIKAGQLVEAGDQVRVLVPPSGPAELTPENIPLDILFENQDLIVVNKPAGMVVHPGAGHANGTLVQAALAHTPEMEGIGGELRPGVVHRLDKDTSGIILLAKNDAAHRWLQDQFRLRKVEKVYLALVDGHPPTPTGRIEAPIGRSSAQRNLMAVVAGSRGREAISEYRTLENFTDHALLEVHPLTGRTHQIRLHLKFIGCPVAGDRVYGHQKASIPVKRHFLHARRLALRLPGEDKMSVFEAPLPQELVQVLNLLRGRNEVD